MLLTRKAGRAASNLAILFKQLVAHAAFVNRNNVLATAGADAAAAAPT